MVGLFMELRSFVMGTFVMGSFGVEIIRLWMPVVFFTSTTSLVKQSQCFFVCGSEPCEVKMIFARA